jgi:hypothetical protein
VDGEPTLLDKANVKFVESLSNPDPEMEKLLELLPPGAFGVWDGSDREGVFALYEMVGSDKLTTTDKDTFKSILGTPVLALLSGGKVTTDAAKILDILGKTVKGEKSGDPGDPEMLKDALKFMKKHVNQSFRDINLVAAIQPKLICWMELRK